MLPGVEVNDVLLHDQPTMAAAKGCNLLYKLSGLLLRDKGGRLERINNDFQFRHAELPIFHIVMRSLPFGAVSTE